MYHNEIAYNFRKNVKKLFQHALCLLFGRPCAHVPCVPVQRDAIVKLRPTSASCPQTFVCNRRHNRVLSV